MQSVANEKRESDRNVEKCLFIIRAWWNTWHTTYFGNPVQLYPDSDQKRFNYEQADSLVAPYLAMKLKQMTFKNSVALSRSKAGVHATPSPICSASSALHRYFSFCQRKTSVFTKDRYLRNKNMVSCFLVEILIAFEEQTSKRGIFYTEVLSKFSLKV